jgi:glycine/D-amino acid oxidase-like deaminating enzyme
MFDVGVIGAGIHGASAAFHLAGRGLRVVVFERRAPAGGPTGRSSAICRAYYTNAFLAGCARDSIDMFRRYPEITGEESGFRHTGLLFLHPPEDAARVEENARRLNELGVEVDVLDTEEIIRRHPSFDLEGIAVGAWERNAGYADPALATGGLFKRALELGAEHRLGRTVTRIEPHDSGGASVETDDGDRVSCGRLLVAAGPWTRSLVQQAGQDLPLTVERHIVGTYRWGEATPQPAHGDLIGGYYFRPEGDELFLVGPLHAASNVDPDHFEERASERELHELAQPVIRRIPELERSSIHGGWASLYDVSPDWQPVIGEVAPGIFVDAGTSGHGFKLAPALGGHVAALVSGEEVDPGILEFHPSRFGEGREVSAGYGEARLLG